MSRQVKEKVTLEKIHNYDPLNNRANSMGMVSEWVGKNAWGNSVAFGDTRKECEKDARNKGYAISR